jgi:hypothetical protein
MQVISMVINRSWSCDWHWSYMSWYEMRNVPWSRKPAFPIPTIVSHHKTQIAVYCNCLWELCIVFVLILRTAVHLQENSRPDMLAPLILALLTYSMDQSSSWESNRFAASQEILRILWNPYGTHRFITEFISACHLSLSLILALQNVYFYCRKVLHVHFMCLLYEQWKLEAYFQNMELEVFFNWHWSLGRLCHWAS